MYSSLTAAAKVRAQAAAKAKAQEAAVLAEDLLGLVREFRRSNWVD